MSQTRTRVVKLEVNGDAHQVVTEARRTLAEILREDLGLTGTHLGCEHGVCGACTVSLDGDAVRSCLVLAGQADGAVVATIESLAGDDPSGLGALQTAMWDESSFQCAFCAPGFLMTLHCLIEKGERPTGDALRTELSGNLCRCTGYASILAGAEVAIRAAGPATNDGSETDDA